MAVKLAFNRIEQFCDGTGIPYSGAKLFTYSAGSSTKLTTYTESTGSSANTNPIVLDSSGRMPQPVWLTVGSTYKFVLAPSTDSDPPTSPIWSMDNISGINDATVTLDQWVSGPTPTFVGATSFTLSGDQTSIFHIGRRLKTTNTAGTVYSEITNSVFGALTTVTVVNDSGSLDSGLSAVSYALLSNNNHSIPSFQAKADLLTQSAAGTIARLAVGVNGTGLVADSSQTTGLIYKPIPIALTASAGTNTVTATASPAPTAYATGQQFFLVPAATNTAAATMNVNSLGAKNVFFAGAACSGGELVISVPVLLEYDGTQFNIIGPVIGSRLTASLGADVNLNNTANYFSGPVVAQGTVGVFLAFSTITANDTGAAAAIHVKLWDGTTVADSAAGYVAVTNQLVAISVAGLFTNPAGNIRADVKDATNTSGVLKFNSTGNSKDSTITVVRVA